ncbi:hypothetical protein K457DRAFT_143634 [Linnemannia elongata AG-77]|uniref:F-box domain-containing protein n=1 Tax=Linnemannia elongata AG-77 TaxID=1314771 RepID=A0A197JED0_9FUNG|nr:hypothetical protein K457DRAFT_1838272 [Linnemannia elongata AG-77]OAQ22851.1 hypothetical protein K457DRAFT_143634 [Linnemannia elongata AG-77]
MQVVAISPPTKALDLPEIRARVASFLPRRDCLQCMRVSPAWFQDFAPLVWHTIDFDKDATAFAAVTPEILDKYGGFISQTLNISTFEHIQALQHVKVSSIASMKIQLPNNWLWRATLSDLLRRSQGSITSLNFWCLPPQPNTFVEQRNWAVHYMQVNDVFAPFPSSTDPRSNASLGNRLKSLSLTNICLTREGFSSLLQYSPLLDELTLERVMFIYHKPGIPLYTGSALRYLSADFAQVWCNDNLDLSAPCLLLHFPLLEKWHLTSMTRPSNRTIDLNNLDFSSWCPLLKTITFGSYDTDTEAMSALLLSNFKDLESCTLPAKTLVMSTTLGLVSLVDSLTTIRITGDAQDATTTRFLSVIMKLCRNLQVLSFETLVYDVEAVEKSQWKCKDLRELRVRFKGLDTPQKIDGCIKKLCSSRRSGGIALTRRKDVDMISTRVVQHLLQFKKLRTLWLGTEGYYLPCSPA